MNEVKEQKVVIFLESDLEGHRLQESIADALDIAGIQWDFIDSEDIESDIDNLNSQKLKVCKFNQDTNMYGDGDVILDNSTGKYFQKEDVAMSEHGDWFVEGFAVEVELDKIELSSEKIYGKSIIINNSDGSSHEFDITKTSFLYNDSGDISKFVIDVEENK